VSEVTQALTELLDGIRRRSERVAESTSKLRGAVQNLEDAIRARVVEEELNRIAPGVEAWVGEVGFGRLDGAKTWGFISRDHTGKKVSIWTCGRKRLIELSRSLQGILEGVDGALVNLGIDIQESKTEVERVRARTNPARP
jgi:hypothetical protein